MGFVELDDRRRLEFVKKSRFQGRGLDTPSVTM